MKIKKNNNRFFPSSSGQASKMLLVLAIIVFVAIIIVYIVIKATERPAPPPVSTDNTVPTVNYEAILGDIKFTFQEAVDMGNILYGSESISNQYQQKDLTTTEKFIIVTIGAKNQGKENVPERVWDMGNIVDSEGRIFVPLDSYLASPWMPAQNLCGVLLKPEFTPVPCKKIYEVSKISKGLKIEAKANKKISATQYSTSSDSQDTALIDLIVTPR